MLKPFESTDDLISACCEVKELREKVKQITEQIEQLEDQIRETIGLEDRIPGVGIFRRSDAYLSALRMRRSVVPSYFDENGEILYLYRCQQYISRARRIGAGRAGVGLVLLDIVEHQRVRRAIRSDQNE